MERSLLAAFGKLNFSPKVLIADKNNLVLELRVMAKPLAKCEKIIPGPLGEFIIHVKDKPLQGSANQAIIRLLSKFLGLAQSQILICSGEKSKTKKLTIHFYFSDTKNENYFCQKLLSSYGKMG